MIPRCVLLMSAGVAFVSMASATLAQSDCYRASVLSDNPIAYWRFNESPAIPGGGLGGAVADQMFAHPGVFRNGVVLGVQGSPRLGTGTSARFSLTSRVDITEAPVVSSLNAHTVEVWFKADTINPGENFLYSEDVQGGSVFCVRINNGVMQYGIFSGSAWRFATGTTVIQTGKWYFTAAVLGPTGQQLYLWDGTSLKLEASNPATGPSTFSALSAEIGCGRFTTGATFNHFQGSIDEVAVFSTPLSLARFQDRVLERAPRITTQPADTSTCPGGSVSLSIATTGDPATSYQWRRDGVPILGATTNPFAFNAGPVDSGEYDCVVGNGCGSIASRTAEVRVCVGDFDCSGGTPDATDLAVFFDAWLVGDPLADIDGSGGTPDSSDIDAFFARWLAGC
jgi:hypothetical protein